MGGGRDGEIEVLHFLFLSPSCTPQKPNQQKAEDKKEGTRRKGIAQSSNSLPYNLLKWAHKYFYKFLLQIFKSCIKLGKSTQKLNKSPAAKRGTE